MNSKERAQLKPTDKLILVYSYSERLLSLSIKFKYSYLLSVYAYF